MKSVTSQKVVTLQRKRGRPPRDARGILQAAVTVFAREGYAAATIEMIAAEASASTATLYKQFTNKHGLFVAVLKRTTNKALLIHIDNRGAHEHAFSNMINRLEAHALVSSDVEVRGVMRAWISEVRSRNELSELFAVNSGRDLADKLVVELDGLGEIGYVDFSKCGTRLPLFAAHVMLGVVERFTLIRGLVLGDNSQPIFSPRGVAEYAVHAMLGIWGTPKGISAFMDIPKTNLEFQGPSLANHDEDHGSASLSKSTSELTQGDLSQDS